MDRQRRTGRNRWRIVAGVVGAVAMTATAASAKHGGGGGLALPIIGGVAGGGLLTSAIYQQHEISQMQDSKQGGGGSAPAAAPQYIYVPAQPVYAAPAYPAYDGTPDSSIQGRLQELDNLCAQGLITPTQCPQRRQQIIDGL